MRPPACLLLNLLFVMHSAMPCWAEADRQPSVAAQLVGAWRVDPARTFPKIDTYVHGLEQRFADEDFTDFARDLRASISKRELEVGPNDLWLNHGPIAGRNEYEVLESGADYVVLRRFVPEDSPLLYSVDGPRHLRRNDIMTQEIVEEAGLRRGTTEPYIMGFEFVEPEVIRPFSFVVADGRLTDERKYGLEYYKRVSETPGNLDEPVEGMPDAGDVPPQQSHPFLYGSLLYAIELGQQEKVQQLLQRHPWLVNDNGERYNPTGEIRTPLHHATAWARHEVAQFLMAHGAEPNVQDKAGNSPLHGAVLSADRELVKALLDAGADVSLANNREQTPLDLARSLADPERRDQIVSLLEEARQ